MSLYRIVCVCTFLVQLTLSIPQNLQIDDEPSSGTSGQSLQACLSTCVATPEYNPICGTDGRNYRNAADVRCARQCGVAVETSFLGTCQKIPDPSDSTTTPPRLCSPLDRIRILKNRRVNCVLTRELTTTPPVSTSTSSSTTPAQNEDRSACIGRCPALPIYNPVCGSNRMTYDNEAKLRCAQSCGVDVSVDFIGKCTRRSLITTSTARAARSLPPDYFSCIKGCTIRPVNRPVCGSDGASYMNTDDLECATRCGIDVVQVKEGNCD